MSQYEELIKALRRCQFGHGMCAECPYYGHKGKWNGEDLSDCDDKMHLDAAAAIEELQVEVRFWEAAVKGQEDGIKVLQTEVKRLKDSNDELREKQTFIDNWGTRWMTSAKDVPDSAYKHGYADGKYEALTLERCIDRLHELGWLQEHDRILSQPHWVSVDERLPNVGQYVLAWEWGQFAMVDKYCGNGKWGLSDASAKYTHWMPLPEPPQEVQDADR